MLYFLLEQKYSQIEILKTLPSARGFQGEKYVKQKQYKKTILINLSFVLYISLVKNFKQTL